MTYQKRADQRNFHYIYKITRTDGSGKYYIGMHSSDNLEDGYFGSGKIITRSIKKHGKHAHVKEILEHCDTRAELKAREKEIVNVECLADKKCMNLKLGGEGGGLFWGNPNSIIPLKDPLVKLKAGRAAHVTISNRMLNADYKNKRFDIMSKAQLGNKSWAGKTHSLETKKKMQASHLGKQDGEKNSQFGTCWVTKDGKSIKIRKQELFSYTQQGFVSGRKMK